MVQRTDQLSDSPPVTIPVVVGFGISTPEQVRAFVDGHGENIAAMGSVSTLEGAFATGTQNTVLSAVKDYVVQYVVALKKAGLLA